ncbi:MAG: aspartate aminotransferase family protein [Eubacterium sp.]|nr:aspartate aminotransferase family protein [Eubacterium sp.]
MNSKEYMTQTEQNLLHTYNRFQIVLEKGDGVYLYDTDGNKYLDFASGIGVMSLGYGNTEYKEALKNQIDKLTHVSNLFYSTTVNSAAARLKKASKMDRVFFTNSGTEAIEGAIKTAKKYAYTLSGGNTDHEIIAMNKSFHGRSLGALSVTGNDHYREPFEGLIPGIKFADFNDIDSVNALVNEKTCAIILEPLQGEGGIYLASEEFMAGLKKLQQEKNILLIFDEVQCGIGRTGKMFTYQYFDIMPDIICCAKGIGNGVPVGAFAMREKVAEKSLVPGDHGTTYGGNPFVCAAVDKVLEIFERDDMLSKINETAEYFEKELDKLVLEFDVIKERRGKGLMQGLELSISPGDVIKDAMANGLIVISAEGNVLRMLPPLVIDKNNVDEMIGILRKTFEKF